MKLPAELHGMPRMQWALLLDYLKYLNAVRQRPLRVEIPSNRVASWRTRPRGGLDGRGLE